MPKPDAGHALPRLQDHQALRPGHLGGDGGVPAAPRRDGVVATRGSPSAAWRPRPSAPPTPRRRSSASPGPRRRSRPAIAALGEDFQPITDMRASAGYRLAGRPQPAAPPARRDHEPRPRPVSSASGASRSCLSRDPGRRPRAARPRQRRAATSPARRSTSTTCPSPRACCTSSSASRPRRTRGSSARSRARARRRRAWSAC